MDTVKIIQKQKWFVTKELKPRHWVHLLISIVLPCWIIVWIYYCIWLRKIRKLVPSVPKIPGF